ncbi:uncharacterized protein [Temnothorax nylanderi]|uniref:uncharacterized protein n=1 Tax=Temnothorax nylanderi TaxID=102681 RepID=UPI003A85DC5F
MTPAFTSLKIKQMFPIVKECSEELAKYLESKAEMRDSIEMKDTLQVYLSSLSYFLGIGQPSWPYDVTTENPNSDTSDKYENSHSTNFQTPLECPYDVERSLELPEVVNLDTASCNNAQGFIFLFLLFNSLDRQMFGNRSVFQKAIDELHYLQTEGIIIKHKDGNKQVYFVLSLVVGDNLGVHSIIGFVESFNATFFCRFCLINRKNICDFLDERMCILRNVDNYISLLALKDVSKSGIVSQCVFNVLDYFHVTKNLCVDVMHDILEGVCRYDLALFLNYFIDKKYLALIDVNTRIRSFWYSHKHNIKGGL